MTAGGGGAKSTSGFVRVGVACTIVGVQACNELRDAPAKVAWAHVIDLTGRVARHRKEHPASRVGLHATYLGTMYVATCAVGQLEFE